MTADKIDDLCPRCAAAERAEGEDWCAKCTRAIRRKDPLPIDEVWRVIFAGGKLPGGDDTLTGAVDDARRLAVRGPIAREHASRIGKGWRSITLVAESPPAPSPKIREHDEDDQADDDEGFRPPAPDPVGEEVAAQRADLEARIRAELHKALTAARQLHEALNAIDRLVPEEAPTEPVNIGKPQASADCLVCDKTTVRPRRGMDEPCYRAWKDAGMPDLEPFKLQRRAYLADLGRLDATG